MTNHTAMQSRIHQDSKTEVLTAGALS